MLSPSYLLAVIFISIQGSCGQIVMTQTPDSISVSPGQTATITCTSSTGIYSALAWYQQISGKSPSLLIHSATARHTGVPDRFSGRRNGSFYTLTILAVTEDDEGSYYCLQHAQYPFTQ
ncbi:hypothetical protein AB205_0062870 [Aquarana catesbeiana]|uniref:Ig-like domain-containing protein n=1 Tax=Aquarana catesbeiana TaxID=8400 RepID=A0A2G9Q965_AQUCT|nr:hypothetical protein AB205_0062870 [Aquarana catesbeiana]